jgi:hypothetical protein
MKKSAKQLTIDGDCQRAEAKAQIIDLKRELIDRHEVRNKTVRASQQKYRMLEQILESRTKEFSVKEGAYEADKTGMMQRINWLEDQLRSKTTVPSLSNPHSYNEPKQADTKASALVTGDELSKPHDREYSPF